MKRLKKQPSAIIAGGALLTTLLATSLVGCEPAKQSTKQPAKLADKNQSETRCQLAHMPTVNQVAYTAAEALPGYCLVTGTIEDEINFEVRLPEEWNGRFVMSGGGGFVGDVVNYVDAAFPGKHYATAGTDTGHRGHPLDASWAIDHPQRLENFGGRAVHLTTETAKQVIEHYYGKASDRNLFYGCSRGGGQGLIAAERYPHDYDLIIAGAPAYNWTHYLGGHFSMISNQMFPDPAQTSHALIGEEQWQLVHNAVMAQCASDLPIHKGLISEPWQCDFDVASLACSDDQDSDCLSEAQVKVLSLIYDGAYDSHGNLIAPGFYPGAEIAEAGVQRWLAGGTDALQLDNFQTSVTTSYSAPHTPNFSYAFGQGIMRDMVFNGSWERLAYDFDQLDQDTAKVAKQLNIAGTDLSEFRNAGGKLMMWTGLRDMAISPASTIKYYQHLVAQDPAVIDDVRLFLMPGVDHCSGGDGPFWVDFLNEAEQWLDTGDAPTEVLALGGNESDGFASRSKLCAYPDVLEYDGEGELLDPESYHCREVKYPPMFVSQDNVRGLVF
ncbi:tannase/feruloyl esterase family alpha/beta hydrolase [Corallincola luteus]|uniref:Tannase/feruloyl esterase family alpha/beta hydrolase n=1 Tax=Corallincola luteus TaxID=1775177 RepID=A0ABY2AIH4_9GAMM|nr:tannase/feruloyl esterase family alpha/beta hydrolase [Corallincola luteus]TCI02429.1 tannase/feruloyl esterase family alpha/beta hydrolase [Corallincola luteus]